MSRIQVTGSRNETLHALGVMSPERVSELALGRLRERRVTLDGSLGLILLEGVVKRPQHGLEQRHRQKEDGGLL